jgi:hypothetical protein
MAVITDYQAVLSESLSSIDGWRVVDGPVDEYIAHTSTRSRFIALSLNSVELEYENDSYRFVTFRPQWTVAVYAEGTRAAVEVAGVLTDVVRAISYASIPTGAFFITSITRARDESLTRSWIEVACETTYTEVI